MQQDKRTDKEGIKEHSGDLTKKSEFAILKRSAVVLEGAFSEFYKSNKKYYIL